LIKNDTCLFKTIMYHVWNDQNNLKSADQLKWVSKICVEIWNENRFSFFYHILTV